MGAGEPMIAGAQPFLFKQFENKNKTKYPVNSIPTVIMSQLPVV